MPVKRCICSICNKDVTKGSTLHIGDGKRACKFHPGVTEKSEQLAQLEAGRIKDQQERAKPKAPHPLYDRQNMFKPKCWRCGETGIYEQDWFGRMLINMEKHEITTGGPANPFTTRFAPAERCIYRLSKDVLNGKWDKIPRVSNQLIEISGIVCLCIDCMSNMKIDPPACKDMTAEKLIQFSGLYEVAMKPVIREMAAKELARDN